MVEHYDVPPDPDSKGKLQALSAAPAYARIPSRVPQRLSVIEVFNATVRAVEDGIAQADGGGTPLSLTDSTMAGITDSLRECSSEQVAKKLRIDRPELQSIVV